MKRLSLACEQQTHFRSSRLSPRKIAIFQRERSDDQEYVSYYRGDNPKKNPQLISAYIFSAKQGQLDYTDACNRDGQVSLSVSVK